MPIVNADIEAIFNELADILEIKGENPFRVRAYRNAARNIEAMGKPVAEMVKEDADLTVIPGIGKDLAEKIKEIVSTGKLSKLEELKKETPQILLELLSVEGLGPKRIRTLYDTLHFSTIKELRAAAMEGKISQIHGFGKKIEEAILEEIKIAKKEGVRFKWIVAEEYTSGLVNHLKDIKGVSNVEVAGSFRRKKETVGDLDILITAEDGGHATKEFVKYEDIDSVLSRGSTRSTVILRSGLQVDVRAVPLKSFGAALCYFTGSKAHNIAIRSMAQKLGLKVNEYGVFKGEKMVAGKTEEEVYASVGLPFIEPELRENQGEIEAAIEGRLPQLIKIEDLKGDLHVHTNFTDGQNSLEELSKAAQKRGYEYLGITDHSKRLAMVGGLDEKRLRKQGEEIDIFNEKSSVFKFLKGIEVDILEDGSLDLSDDILKELDFVVGAIHYKFNLSEEKQTERLIRAMDNPYLNIIAHPTGRLIGQREGYRLQMDRLLTEAKKRGCIMELNAQPDRLDLTDKFLRMAKEAGVKIAISTDTHSLANLAFIRLGVFQARRGWIEPKDVVNTLSISELKKALRRN